MVWYELLKYRYSNPKLKMFINDKRVLHKGDSVWCQDLVMINDCIGSRGLSTSNIILCKVKNGAKTAFWFNRWIGDQAISEALPELYARAAKPLMSLAKACHWEEGVWLCGVQYW